MAGEQLKVDRNPAVLEDVSTELKRFYGMSLIAVVSTAIAAVALCSLYAVPFLIFEEEPDLPKMVDWFADWRRTTGKPIDVLAAAPAVAALVLAVWIANALAAPINDELIPVRERARRLMLDQLTASATLIGALALWVLVPVAAFGPEGVLGAAVAALLALFCSALTPLANARADTHRLEIRELKRRRRQLHEQFPSSRTPPQYSTRWRIPMQVLPWRVPVLLAIAMAVVVAAAGYFAGTRLPWWAALARVSIVGILEWVWTYMVMLPTTLWSVKRITRGWSHIVFFLPWVLVSLMYALPLGVGAWQLSGSLLPPSIVLLVYVMPLVAWFFLRDTDQLQALKTLYAEREDRSLHEDMATQAEILDRMSFPDRRRSEADVNLLLHEVQELRAVVSPTRHGWRRRRFSRKQ